MQKCHVAIVISDAAGGVRLSRLGVYPALRSKSLGVWAPHFQRTVNGPGRDVDSGACWDKLIADCAVADGNTGSSGHGRVEAENFVRDGVEEGKGLENAGYIDSGI